MGGRKILIISYKELYYHHHHYTAQVKSLFSTQFDCVFTSFEELDFLNAEDTLSFNDKKAGNGTNILFEI